MAREMAHDGEDARLAQMLLELAADMEAEADEIEAKQIETVNHAMAQTLDR